MKKILCFLSMFVLLSCSSTTPHKVNYSTNPFAHKLKDSTVLIVNKEDGGGYSQLCSGVWLNRNIIVTAYHCVSREPKTEKEAIDKVAYNKDPNVIGELAHFKILSEVKDNITENENDKYEKAHTAIIISTDENHDLALVEAVEDDLAHSVAKISKEIVKDGDKVHIIGNPGYLPYSYITGTVSDTREVTNPHDHQMKTLYILSAAWHGYSGGAAFNENGEIVGIASFLRRIPLVSFFIYKDYIIELLKEENISIN